MFRTSKLLLSAAVCGIIGFGAIQANAADVDVPATLSTSPALTIGTPVEFDFASVDFAAAHSGTIVYGPDGNVDDSSGTGLTASGTPIPGSIGITESAATLDITCDATATMTSGTGVELTISEVKWDILAAPPTYAAAANTCDGLTGTIVSVDTSVVANNDPTITLGATITFDSNELIVSEVYDTATGTGDPITFRIVVQ